MSNRTTTRVQIELPPSSMNRLKILREKTEASSYSEVLKNALQLYEAIIAEKEAGREFLIRDPSGDETFCRIIL